MLETAELSHLVPGPSGALVTISVHNVAGQCLRWLVDQDQATGVHRVLWDGRDNTGAAVGSGICFLGTQIGTSAGQVRLTALRQGF